MFADLSRFPERQVFPCVSRLPIWPATRTRGIRFQVDYARPPRGVPANPKIGACPRMIARLPMFRLFPTTFPVFQGDPFYAQHHAHQQRWSWFR